MAIMQVACGEVVVVLRLETPEPVPLRASVGSTEASGRYLGRSMLTYMHVTVAW
jgi:hypothetical protein